MADTVSDLRWDKRILIVFAADRDLLHDQADRLLADRSALAERDMLVFAVSGEAVEPIYGEPPTGEGADGLRRRFSVDGATPFAAVLIGKDGGVKWRGARPAPLSDINAVIDAMPMRRRGD